MLILSHVLITLVALAHVGFLVIEMFYWNHPVGREIFHLSVTEAESSRPLAMNMGLYNGFLATGLFWGLLAGRTDIKVFFLCCVIVAGLFGAATAKRSILFIQALPAALALLAVFAC